MKLHILGRLKINDTPERMTRLGDLVTEFEAPVKLEQNHGWWLVVTGVDEDMEEHFKRFLATVAKEMPGLLVGSLEVWWPLVIESGPQQWTLEEGGKLMVSESTVSWDTPEEFAP